MSGSNLKTQKNGVADHVRGLAVREEKMKSARKINCETNPKPCKTKDKWSI